MSQDNQPTTLTCPNCHAPNVADALFCESCGYDFVNQTDNPWARPPQAVAVGGGGTGPLGAGQAPDAAIDDEWVDGAAAGGPQRQASPKGGVQWVAELWIDPDWYDAQGAPDPMPSAGLPDIVPLVSETNLIGRVSLSKHTFPEIDCDLDTGVSRSHARLTTDWTRWWIEDLDSANGTFVGPNNGPLPTMPIPRGRVELAADQRIYVGAWTRIVIRRATDEERAAFAG
ncbi:MAG: FHA domain-containing protein [Propionibacteriaceae bacterium]|jgi:hypothetical protein|nr:FHA domain-containing protein [Propionibacteriaceae bacterium]